MLMPSIFGESLFDDFDNLMNFSFPDVDKTLYGKHAKNMMKTDVKEKDNGYEVAIDLPGFKKDELHLELNDGPVLTICSQITPHPHCWSRCWLSQSSLRR